MNHSNTDGFRDDGQMLRALCRAGYVAHRRHRSMDLPLWVWSNGRAVQKSPKPLATEIKDKSAAAGAPGMDDMDY